MPIERDVELELLQTLKIKYGPLLREFEADDDLIDGKFSQIIPDTYEEDGFEITRPGTANAAVENAVDHILTNPRISVPVRPVTEGQVDAQGVAEMTEVFHSMWWERAFTDFGDPLRRVSKSLVKGKGVLKHTLRFDLLPNLPENPTDAEKQKYRRAVERVCRSKFLWELEVVPKERVFEDPEHPWEPWYLFEAYPITAGEAIRRFGETPTTKAMQPLDTIEYVEYWSRPNGSDPGRFIQWLLNERVHDDVNPYSYETDISTKDKPDYEGYIPYSIGDPGWGDTGKDARPEDRYVSIIRPARSALVAECRMLTSVDYYNRMYVFPPLVSKGLPADKELRMHPGAHWALPAGGETSIEVLKFGEPPDSLFRGMDRVNAYVDEVSKLGILGGAPQRGVDTATEADANVRNASTKLSGPLRALRRMVMQINRWNLMDIENILEVPVTLYGATEHKLSEVTLKPSDIDGYYFSSVEMDTSDQAALSLRNARTWSDLYQRLPIPATYAMKQAGVQNASSMIVERMEEDLLRSPQAMQLMISALLGAFQQQFPAVMQGFQNQLLGGAQGQPGEPAGLEPAAPTADTNAVEAMRTTSRDQAMSDAPERQMQ